MNREWIGLHQRILIELIEALIEARISADQRCATLVSASAPIKTLISAAGQRFDQRLDQR